MRPYEGFLRRERRSAALEKLPVAGAELGLKVLGRRLEDSKGRLGYTACLSNNAPRLIARDPPNAGEDMRLGRLGAKYRNDYGELRAEWQSEQELL